MSRTFSRKDHTMTWLRAGDLTVAYSDAQRELADSKAKQIAESFDPDLFGTVTVSPLSGGKYHVDDGWTRVSAVRMQFGDNERVPCVVVAAHSASECAQIFYGMNGGRAKPTAMDMFKVGVTAGRVAECAVSAVVECAGLRVHMAQADGCIRAVHALLTIYKQFGEDGLQDVLAFIKDIWGLDNAGFDAPLMRGVALFLAQPDLVKPDRVAKKIARKFTPGRLLGAAKASREAFGGSMSRAVSAIIQEVYAPGGRVPATASPRPLPVAAAA